MATVFFLGEKRLGRFINHPLTPRAGQSSTSTSTSLLWLHSLFFIWRNSPQWARTSSFTRFLDHPQRRTTVGRTPLDEWSARRRDLYLTIHNTHNRQTSMPSVGFEPTISAGERPQTQALDRTEPLRPAHSMLEYEIYLPLGQEFWWSPEWIWRLWRQENILSSAPKITPIPVSYSLYRQTEWDRHRRLKSVTFPSLVLILHSSRTKKAVGLTDLSYNVENVTESGCWKS
jgi:hypothetical protein